MMAMDFQCRRLGAVSGLSLLAIIGSFLIAPSPIRAVDAVAKGQDLSRQGDALLKEGREQQAAERYLAAHVQYQAAIQGFFETALRESLGGPAAERDEDELMQAGSFVGDLRNVNLSKLWIVLDPEDRACQHGLEAERAALLQQFDRFIRAESAGPLDAFLLQLYPDDESGERQMASVRDGRMPPSKRWDRLQRALSP